MVTPNIRATAVVEEVVLYALLVVIGAIPVVGALRSGGALGAEATMGLVLLGLGLSGIAITAARKLRGKG